MRRVARRVVVLTFDTDEPGRQNRFRLNRDHLPEFAAVLAGFPSLAGMADAIGARAEPVPIPWDCADGPFEADGADRQRIRGITCAVRRRCGRGSVLRQSSGRCAASATTSTPAGGPSAAATSSTSTQQASASACSSPDWTPVARLLTRQLSVQRWRAPPAGRDAPLPPRQSSASPSSSPGRAATGSRSGRRPPSAYACMICCPSLPLQLPRVCPSAANAYRSGGGRPSRSSSRSGSYARTPPPRLAQPPRPTRSLVPRVLRLPLRRP